MHTLEHDIHHWTNIYLLNFSKFFDALMEVSSNNKLPIPSGPETKCIDNTTNKVNPLEPYF